MIKLMKGWLKQLKQKPQLIIGPVLILGVTIIGANYLLVSHAANPYAAERATSGSLVGNAQVQQDATASSGSSVKFGSAYCQPSTLPKVSLDTSMDDIISGQLGPGWIAGDASYSTLLPDGREAIDFSDTLIGTAKTDNTATFTGFIHSSELVGTLPNLSSDYNGTYTQPATLLTDSNGGTAQWQVASTYSENGKQLILVNQFTPVTGSDFDHYTGNSGVAVMTIPAGGMPTLSSVVPVPTDSNTQWGNGMAVDSKYHYIYGFSGAGTMKLARVPLGDTLTVSDWQYWNGSTWVNGETNAAEITTTYQLTGVRASGYENGYMAVSIPSSVYTDRSLFVSYACAPQGPWSTPVAIYTVPEISEYDNEIAYMPNFHPELDSSTNGMVISYSVNELNGLTDLETNIHEYQPRFLYLK